MKGKHGVPLIDQSLDLRQRSSLLRLAAWKQQELGERALELLGAEIAGRYQVKSLFAAGGQGVLYAVKDLRGQGRAFHLLKIAKYDWVRPGRVLVDEVRRMRRKLKAEGSVLKRVEGGILPKYVDLVSFRTPLVKEAQPRLAGDEAGLVMELIEGMCLDEVARAIRRSVAESAESDRLIACVLGMLISSLRQISEQLDGAFYSDVAPRNFLLETSGGRLRVVDAGSVVMKPTPVRQLMLTRRYLARNDLASDQVLWAEDAERMIIGCLELLAMDLVTERLALGHSADEVRIQLAENHPAEFVKLLEDMRSGRYRNLAECEDAVRTYAKPVSESCSSRILAAVQAVDSAERQELEKQS